MKAMLLAVLVAVALFVSNAIAATVVADEDVLIVSIAERNVVTVPAPFEGRREFVKITLRLQTHERAVEFREGLILSEDEGRFTLLVHSMSSLSDHRWAPERLEREFQWKSRMDRFRRSSEAYRADRVYLAGRSIIEQEEAREQRYQDYWNGRMAFHGGLRAGGGELGADLGVFSVDIDRDDSFKLGVVVETRNSYGFIVKPGALLLGKVYITNPNGYVSFLFGNPNTAVGFKAVTVGIAGERFLNGDSDCLSGSLRISGSTGANVAKIDSVLRSYRFRGAMAVDLQVEYKMGINSANVLGYRLEYQYSSGEYAKDTKTEEASASRLGMFATWSGYALEPHLYPLSGLEFSLGYVFERASVKRSRFDKKEDGHFSLGAAFSF